MNIDGREIKWKVHDCFRLEANGKVIYFDPFELTEAKNDADYVFITHEHHDHCSPEDLRRVINENTVIITTLDCQSKISSLTFKNIVVVEAKGEKMVDDINVETIPAYNVNKFRSPGVPYHPQDGKVGYIITFAGKRIYHAGDTDNIPDMNHLKEIDIAFMPVSGTYVMTPGEAAGAVNMFKPKLAIPMHYGAIVGSEADAEKFKMLSDVPVEIMQKS